jgi:hypothetical protein
MIKNILYVYLFGATLCGVTFANPAEEELTDKLHLALNSFVAQAWPDNDIAEHPTLIYFPNQYTYAFQLIPYNPRWQPYKELSPSVYFLTQDEYKLASIPLFYGLPIDGQKSYIYSYIPSISLDKNLLMLLHERFHAFQIEQSYFLKYVLGFTLPYPKMKDPENLALSHLELAVLNDYWQHPDSELIKDYIAINYYRTHKMNQSENDYEISKEVFEGLADYFVLMSAPFSNIPSFIQQDINNCLDDINQAIACQRQWRYYATGATTAWWLDQISQDWKISFINHAISPREHLQQVYAMDESTMLARLVKSKAKYNYKTLYKNIKTMIDKYETKLTDHWNNFLVAPGVPTELFSGFTQSGSMGHNEQKELLYLDNIRTLAVDYSANTCANDMKYTLNIQHLPYMLNDVDHDEFKLTLDTVILIDGTRYPLEDLIESDTVYPFTNLTLNNNEINFKITDIPGKFIVQNKKLIIKPQVSLDREINQPKKLITQQAVVVSGR